jgi:hypothetical protein
MKVVCPEHVKTISFDSEWRAEVTVHQTLVFLDNAARGSLQDHCTVSADSPLADFYWKSDDAKEVGRRRRGRDTIVIDWRPREPVVPYALHHHEFSWSPSGSHGSPALCTELRCEMKTGLFQCDIVAQQDFENAVVFERPSWWVLSNERKLIKYALKQLDEQGERPTITDNGYRVEWKLLGPKVGARFVLVAFRRHGVAIWQEELRKTSLFGRARDLIGRVASTT